MLIDKIMRCFVQHHLHNQIYIPKQYYILIEISLTQQYNQ